MMKGWKLGMIMLCLSLSNVITVRADDNACDDYIARHEKRNLVATYLSFKDMNMSDPYQAVKIHLKNVGEREFAGTGLRYLKLSIKGNIRTIQVPMPIASGQTIAVTVAVDPGLLKNCETVPVVIDLNHSVGQWGCQVWNDDSTKLMVHQEGRFCRIPVPPISIPHAELLD